METIANIDMTKEKQAIRAVAISETAVCLECHRKFEMKDLKKHFENDHTWLQFISCQDKITIFSSTKVLHGVCQNGNVYIVMKGFIALALKLLCKTQNEAVVESMGSMIQKHIKPERPGKQPSFTNEMHIDVQLCLGNTIC